MLPAFRRKVYVQLDPRRWPSDRLSPTNALICIAILLATASAVLETEPLVTHGRERLFAHVELGFGLIFVAEYVARFWSAPEADGARPTWCKRLAFALSPVGLIDLVVIATSFAPLLTANVQLLRLLRLLRIVRLAKLGRMSAALHHMAGAAASRRMELALTAGFGAGLILMGATLLYWIE